MAVVISTVPRVLSFMRTTLSVGCKKDRMQID